ncbi:MAG: hypothetical protein ACOC1J_00450 [Prolixibacteraceae bacterium]
MKTIFLFMAIMSSWCYSYSQDSSAVDSLFQQLNSYRDKIGITPMQKDSSLMNALELLAPRMKADNFLTNKDSVRKILSSLAIYDYHVQLTVLNYRESYDSNVLFDKNPDFAKVIHNPYYNKTNYRLITENGEKYLLFIAVQRYINFDDEWFFEGRFLENGNVNGYVVVSGKSRIDQLHYALNNNQINDSNNCNLTLSNIDLKKDNTFSLKVNIGEMNKKKQSHVVFLDSMGKIIANVKIPFTYD